MIRLAVSDTSPINYLVQIGEIDVLASLYGQIVVPAAVVSELTHDDGPEGVRRWASNSPNWVGIRSPTDIVDPMLAGLGAGERSAILLAQEIHADLLPIDDRAGIAAAGSRGLRATGTLGVVDRAASEGLLDFRLASDRLLKTNFRIRRGVVETLSNKYDLG